MTETPLWDYMRPGLPPVWIGPQRSAGGKAKREQDLYPDSGVEKPKRRKALHCIRGAQREQGFSRHVLEILHLLSFPSRNAIAKLAQIHGLSKKGRIRLEVLDFAQPPPCGRHL
jgi:hypothetical protein